MPDRDHQPTAPSQENSQHLSQGGLYLLACASAVVTANAYYIHPIIARVADHFGVNQAMIGLVPALNQIALALGIFLLLPLGDKISNRQLVSVCVFGQFVSIAIMALSNSFEFFVLGSTVLGFFTIAPYLLPAYVSKRVTVSMLGKATSVLASGVIAGILLARAGSGAIAESLGWRSVYFVAAALMLVFTIALPMVMDSGEKKGVRITRAEYFQLLGSLVTVTRLQPKILLLGLIQALNFGIFLSVWMGLGLHLTSPDMGYGVDTVGYLTGFAILNLATTPIIGSWADRVGAPKARIAVAMLQLIGVSFLWVFGWNIWLLIIPIILMNIAGPMIDITGRMEVLSENPDIRTRLMTVYIVLMFTGGGLASWAGTAAYAFAGWHGNAVLAIILSSLVFGLSVFRLRLR